ncbi:hypothetical protein ACMWAM_001915 [Enterococcus faecium]|uniref:hypothetical protein n=1 Tax=Enterococcus faecium TaxID=1352 RepID=UPI0002A30AAA|nr:hypothetical protein [Enterococcus faecium]ELB36624.1 hypothetical protein OK9_03377 [Enterococcus faecium EnGen0033]
MPDTFKIYKKNGTEFTKVAEGESPLSITGIAANTQVAKGDYQATRIVEDQESDKVDIPAFKVLPTTDESDTKTGSSVEVSPAFDPNGNTKPTDTQTIEEIKAWLTAHTIDFAGKTLKADLLALVPTE